MPSTRREVREKVGSVNWPRSFKLAWTLEMEFRWLLLLPVDWKFYVWYFFLVVDSQASKRYVFRHVHIIIVSTTQNANRLKLAIWMCKLNYGSLLYGMQPVKRDEIDRAVWTVMEMFPI